MINPISKTTCACLTNPKEKRNKHLQTLSMLVLQVLSRRQFVCCCWRSCSHLAVSWIYGCIFECFMDKCLVSF